MFDKAVTVLWGAALPALLCFTGVYIAYKTRGRALNPLPALKSLFKKREGGGISSFGAMSSALASCLGTGNIAGVAAALAAGGPGALFYMWVAAVLSMATKYAEVYLAVKYRVKKPGGGFRGGPMYYMERGLGWKTAGAAFAAVCAVCTLGTGNLTQVGAMSEALHASFGAYAPACGFIALAFAAATVTGGAKIVAKTAERLIPFASLLYIAGAAALLFVNRDKIPAALESVFSSAFGLQPVLGGAAGYGVARAIRFGVSRGVFSNEAGMGTSPMAHAGADVKRPGEQAPWGAFEVCADTLIMCTLTGLALLTAGAGGDAGAAFATLFGSFGDKFVAVSLTLFALASVMGWSVYGETCAAYLFGERRAAIYVYRALYLAAVPAGSFIAMDTIWKISDVMNAVMIIPNVAAVIALWRKT